MNTFFSILAAYYVCDAAANQGILRDQIVVECTAIYEEVKATVPGSASSTRVDAFRAFKEWERENADLVREMKAEARIVAAHLARLQMTDEPMAELDVPDR